MYYRIANHYKFIMQQMFDCRKYERLILVEDDMLFAPDFFPYFEATSKILDQALGRSAALLPADGALQPCHAMLHWVVASDKRCSNTHGRLQGIAPHDPNTGVVWHPQDLSLMCVSSWNDHGQRAFVSGPRRVERTDFFPGLGWMLRRETWDSLADQWCGIPG